MEQYIAWLQAFGQIIGFAATFAASAFAAYRSIANGNKLQATHEIAMRNASSLQALHTRFQQQQQQAMYSGVSAVPRGSPNPNPR